MSEQLSPREQTLQTFFQLWKIYDNLQEERRTLSGSLANQTANQTRIEQINKKLKEMDPEINKLRQACFDMGVTVEELTEEWEQGKST